MDVDGPGVESGSVGITLECKGVEVIRKNHVGLNRWNGLIQPAKNGLDVIGLHWIVSRCFQVGSHIARFANQLFLEANGWLRRHSGLGRGQTCGRTMHQDMR